MPLKEPTPSSLSMVWVLPNKAAQDQRQALVDGSPMPLRKVYAELKLPKDAIFGIPTSLLREFGEDVVFSQYFRNNLDGREYLLISFTCGRDQGQRFVSLTGLAIMDENFLKTYDLNSIFSQISTHADVLPESERKRANEVFNLISSKTEDIETSNPGARGVFQMLSLVAEIEQHSRYIPSDRDITSVASIIHRQMAKWMNSFCNIKPIDFPYKPQWWPGISEGELYSRFLLATIKKKLDRVGPIGIFLLTVLILILLWWVFQLRKAFDLFEH